MIYICIQIRFQVYQALMISSLCVSAIVRHRLSNVLKSFAEHCSTNLFKHHCQVSYDPSSFSFRVRVQYQFPASPLFVILVS